MAIEFVNYIIPHIRIQEVVTTTSTTTLLLSIQGLFVGPVRSNLPLVCPLRRILPVNELEKGAQLLIGSQDYQVSR